MIPIFIDCAIFFFVVDCFIEVKVVVRNKVIRCFILYVVELSSKQNIFVFDCKP